MRLAQGASRVDGVKFEILSGCGTGNRAPENLRALWGTEWIRMTMGRASA